jgi:hypothetical protein
MPKSPTHAYLDLDAVLFSAASAGEQVRYTYYDENNNEVADFDSAEKGKAWLEGMIMLGIEQEYRRETTYEIHEVEKAYKTFDHILQKWIKKSKCDKWVGYVSKNSGTENFRHQIATVAQYKGNRSPDARKPHYLEAVRKYALTHPSIKKGVGSVEVDDQVMALAQRKGERGLVLSVDKDVRGIVGSWFLIPDEMEKAQFSRGDIVGEISWDKTAKKAKGCGYLFLLQQAGAGDDTDGYFGCKGLGHAGAVKLLEPFSGKPMSYLPQAVKSISDRYMKVYGKEYKYNHWNTGEEIIATGNDIFIEMLHLAYMKKSTTDICPLIEIVEGL